jgi:hypothetical protein
MMKSNCAINVKQGVLEQIVNKTESQQ